MEMGINVSVMYIAGYQILLYRWVPHDMDMTFPSSLNTKQ